MCKPVLAGQLTNHALTIVDKAILFVALELEAFLHSSILYYSCFGALVSSAQILRKETYSILMASSLAMVHNGVSSYSNIFCSTFCGLPRFAAGNQHIVVTFEGY